jgi:hypothetical protein
MKVRCVKFLDATGMTTERSAWLTLGKIYHVLEIFINQHSIRFRLISDSGTPALLHFSQFELISNFIPSCWVVNFRGERFLEIAPNAWAQDDFWNRYFDGEQNAREIFKKTYDSILIEEP